MGTDNPPDETIKEKIEKEGTGGKVLTAFPPKDEGYFALAVAPWKDGRIVLGVSGTYPIRDIEQQKDESLWVVMSLDGGVGETATVRRTKRGWQVTEVLSWVS